MDSYKLIKKYPGSPALGTEVIDTNHMGPSDPYQRWMMYVNNEGAVKRDHVIDQPEYWHKLTPLTPEQLRKGHACEFLKWVRRRGYVYDYYRNSWHKDDFNNIYLGEDELYYKFINDK